MEIAVLGKVALAVLVPSITCLTLCTFEVQSVHGWMMRHDCPIAKLSMHPPSRTVGSDALQGRVPITTP
jgi:hypothetical protein